MPAVEVETVNAFCGGFDTRRVDMSEYDRPTSRWRRSRIDGPYQLSRFERKEAL